MRLEVKAAARERAMGPLSSRGYFLKDLNSFTNPSMILPQSAK